MVRPHIVVDDGSKHNCIVSIFCMKGGRRKKASAFRLALNFFMLESDKSIKNNNIRNITSDGLLTRQARVIEINNIYFHIDSFKKIYLSYNRLLVIAHSM